MTAISFGRSRYQANEDDVTFVPSSYRTSERGVLWCHGLGGTAVSACDPTTGEYDTIRRIARVLPVVATDLGGLALWGNLTAQDRVEAMRAYLGSQVGAINDKVHLVGGSAGALVALNYAQAHPDRVASIALVIGAIHLDFIYQGNINGQRASIETAWGIAHPTPLPDGADPFDSPASLRGIPLRSWHVTDDLYTPIGDYTTFLTAAGGTSVTLGALGHTTAATLAAAPDLAAWVTNQPA